MVSKYFSDLPKPIAIIGLGISGQAIFELLIEDGISENELILFDEKAKSAHFNTGSELLSKGRPKTLVVSPGVPLQTPWIKDAVEQGLLLTSELSLAYRVLTNEKIIAITGSIGKSTTTCLLQSALNQFSPHSFVGGNLGIPLAIYSKELIQRKRPKADWIVLELSSYQLENFSELKADYSIITYFTANHLERYNSKEDYYQTKWTLESKTKNTMVLAKNGGDLYSWCQNQTQHIPWIWTDRTSVLVTKYNLDQCELLGSHNLDNIALAAEIIKQAEMPEIAYPGLRKFRGLSHRVENVGTFNGVRFINDSKATTIESVKIGVTSSLETVPPHCKLHLLLGGRDKNLPWKDLHFLKDNPQIQFYFFGECRNLAKTVSGLPGEEYPSMVEAVPSAIKNAQVGDSILLSPGGTSLDEFKNFEVRGDVFKELAIRSTRL